MEYSQIFQVIWADIDPNMHLRHTAYNDYAAQVRVSFLADHGFSLKKFMTMAIGPILFREETRFLREVGINEKIKVDYHCAAMRKDGSRFKGVHSIWKEDGVQAAIITIEGAWIDTNARKLTIPPLELLEIINKIPRVDNFEYIPDKQH